MSVSRDDNGDIKLDSEDHSISFSWNKQVTPPSEDEQSRNEMIRDAMGTPRSGKSRTKISDKYLIQPSLEDME